MGGFDDQQGVMGDWMLPSPNPSPRTFFASLLGEDIGSRSTTENNSELEQQTAATANPDEKDERQVHSPGDILADQKICSRGGLLDRRAAKLGFNPPRLNTDLEHGHEIRSPYLTIPQGLSPTTLLDSPVFLSNSLVQPSPTTGKFAMFGSYENINSSFTFKPVEESRPSLYMGATSRAFPAIEVASSSAEQSPPLDDQQDEDVDQRASGPAEDGYNWRKYGQKQVKGSDYPRSYFKCTHPNCPVKKKVERSHEGHITEIIYKGAHNHPKPPSNRRSSLDNAEETVTDVDHTWKTIQNGNGSSPPDWRHENFEYGNGSVQSQLPSNFSNDEVDDEDDRDTGSVSLDQGGEEEESESKRRKIETYAAEMSGATRAIREPRVVVQTTSEVDILDDGYRWRKYGQKVVKGNPNPRSYYKCTSAGCTVRKHVERASNDLKSVITTYEGKHNHDVPAARNSSHVNSGGSGNQSGQATSSVQSLVHRPEPSQIHNSMAGYGRPPAFGSFSAPWRSQLGLSHGFGFGMTQQGIGNFGMSDMGQGAGISMNQFSGQRHVDDMTFMLPKAEPKMEPISEASSYHHQLMNMNTFPGGPQM